MNCGLAIADCGLKKQPMAVSRTLILATALCSAVSYGSDEAFDRARFEWHVAALCSGGHRISGTSEAAQAGTHIENELKALGYPVYHQHFNVPQSLSTECRISLDGKDYELFPMRPNLLQASITPKEGLSGSVIYAGAGMAADFDGVDPRGAIVVLDYSQRGGGCQAFAMGAAAVIFVEDEQMCPFYEADKQVNLSANLPRFYMRREVAKAAGLLQHSGSKTAAIFASAAWKVLEGVNLITVIPGRAVAQPDGVSEGQQEEAMVVSCDYDSLGSIPDLAPGARAAANCAGLLEMARLLKNSQPTRAIVLAFFDDRCQNHLGARNFYYAVQKIRPDINNPDQLDTVRSEFYSSEKKDLEDDIAALRQIIDATAQPAAQTAQLRNIRLEVETQKEISNFLDRIFRWFKRFAGFQEADSTDKSLLVFNLSKRAVDELDRSASWKADVFVEPIGRLNRALASHTGAGDKAQAYTKKLEELKEQRSHWNRLRQGISNHTVPPAEQSFLTQAASMAVERQSKRVAELDVLQSRNAENIQVGRLFYKPVEPGGAGGTGGAGKALNLRIVAHFSLQFGDASSRWGVVIGGNHPLDQSTLGQRRIGTYSRVLGAIRTAVKTLRRDEHIKDALPNFHDATVEGLHEPSMWISSPFTHSGEVAEGFGYFGLCLMTIGDGYLREGLPGDTVSNLNLDLLLPQCREAAQLVKALADEPGFSVRGSLFDKAKHCTYQRTGGTLTGFNVVRMQEGASIADQPAIGAIVGAMPAERLRKEYFIPGFDRNSYSVCDANGYYDVPSIVQASWAVDAAFFDERGQITDLSAALPTPDFPRYFNLAATARKLELFRAQGSALCQARDALKGMPILEGDWKLLNGQNDANFSRYYLRQVDTTLAFYVPYSYPTKLFARGIVAVFNATSENPLGTGMDWDCSAGMLAPAESRQPPPCGRIVTAVQSANDLTLLNASRLKILQSAGLVNNSLEMIHGFAEDQAVAMSKAEKTNDWGKAYAYGESAAVAESRIYQPIMETMNDVITAAIFLLGLAIPFAFSLERLLVGTPNIYRQAGAFLAFFIATFALLYLIHPAFALAATPFIIFLAFAIIVLSGFVIILLMQKFRQEIRVLQGMASTVHGVDLSRIGTALASIQMGISIMRRRPLRTTLTAVTVVLLTFTILCFASMNANSGVVEDYLGQQFNREAILIHTPAWLPMPVGQLQFITGLLRNDAEVYGKVWLAGELNTTVELPVMRTDRRGFTLLKGIVALPRIEAKATPEIFGCLTGDVNAMLDGNGIFLSRDVMNELKASPGDEVIVKGKRFKIAGYFDEEKVDQIRQLDGSPFLPVDYEAARESANDDRNRTPDEAIRGVVQTMDAASITSLSPTQVAFMSEKNLLEIGGKIRAIVIIPKHLELIGDIARKAARLTDSYVFCGLPDGVHKFYYAARLTFTGLGDLIVPLLLGGLIVFSTMLGSVVEREKEIYTFSALGLAPPHVAMLFFAEVAIYAVLGGLGGYLAGQSAVCALSWLNTHYGIGSVPEVNYSSMTVVFTILTVMATVMISTIYPAFKASRSANPGVQRNWKIPRPNGDIHDIVFPFTVSVYDMKGIVSFLREHFENHSDISLGEFSAKEAEIFEAGGPGMLGLRAKINLAPFDLGISQSIEMMARPSEIEGIQEVTIKFVRLSGRPSNWERFNRVFITEIRKQFLIWRALKVEAMEAYRASTDEALNVSKK